MPKRFIQKYMPEPEKLREHKSLGFLGEVLHEPNLWHINRHAVSKAFLVGIFMCFIPVPFQMVFAALLAVWINCNLPLAIVLCWITNPLTMPPIFYFNYWVGAHILGRPPVAVDFQLSFEWIASKLYQVGIPLYLGSLVVAVLAAGAAYAIVEWLWRRHVRNNWKQRCAERAARNRQSATQIHPS